MDVGEPYRTKRSQDSGLQTQVENTPQDYRLRYRTHVRTTDSGIEHTSGLQTQVENTRQDYRLR